MKVIKCHTGEVKTTEVICAVMRNPIPGRGVDYEEMGKRVRIIEIVNKHTGDELKLEDADHAYLCGVMKSFPYGVADAALLETIKDVLEAKAPEDA